MCITLLPYHALPYHVYRRFAGMTGAQIERERAKVRHSKKNSLSDLEYDEFSEILAKLTVSRSDILNGMGFALDGADMAADIVAMLKKSLLVIATPAPLKIARLYLLSDILHNSGADVKNAASYR
jgi:U2-associated protein SR140